MGLTLILRHEPRSDPAWASSCPTGIVQCEAGARPLSVDGTRSVNASSEGSKQKQSSAIQFSEATMLCRSEGLAQDVPEYVHFRDAWQLHTVLLQDGTCWSCCRV